MEFITLTIALLTVIFILFLTYWATKKLAAGSLAWNKTKEMKIIDRIAVGQERNIIILAVKEEYYLIGVTEKSIQVLNKLEDFQPSPLQQQEGLEPNGFQAALLRKLQRKKPGGEDKEKWNH